VAGEAEAVEAAVRPREQQPAVAGVVAVAVAERKSPMRAHVPAAVPQVAVLSHAVEPVLVSANVAAVAVVVGLNPELIALCSPWTARSFRALSR
jgi:hypothetical protein